MRASTNDEGFKVGLLFLILGDVEGPSAEEAGAVLAIRVSSLTTPLNPARARLGGSP
jgi:hypothetical protein